ncbi:MAG: hypothetical protein ACI9FN_002330 [Saprospiraceae bacterium]|jgi:hypothetical protein
MDYTFKGTLAKNDDHLYNYHIVVPQEIVLLLKENKIDRFLCSLNTGKDFHASLIPAGNDEYFIKINKEIRQQYGLNTGTICSLSITEDNSEYGIPMPDEMSELLNQDNEGNIFFHNLTPGKQRGLLFLVNKVKSTAVRIDKSLIILEHLKEMNGKLDYKILHQDFKNKKGTF